jgi:beta-alanine degradation protein BauB
VHVTRSLTLRLERPRGQEVDTFIPVLELTGSRRRRGSAVDPPVVMNGESAAMIGDDGDRRMREGEGMWMPEPGSHEVQVENDRVRVSRWDLAPGQGTGKHEHLHDYVVVRLVNGQMRIGDLSGANATADLGAGSSYYRTAGVFHEVVNCGDSTLSFVEVEVLGK